MGLRQRLGSYAVGGAHVLVVEVPGWWTERVAIEQAVAARGWAEALSPADADVLVVCGEPGSALASAADAVWEQLPGPRARVTVRHGDTAEAVLDAAAALLLDDGQQRADARDRPRQPAVAGMDGMEGMDHGGTDMAPAGIALAGGGPDRDGLEMDVLHVPLGPVLSHWPAGLVVRCALQGDVVVGASVEVLPADAPPPVASADADVHAAALAARRCDSVARLLAVAGWHDAATRARRARDHALAGDHDAAARALSWLGRRVARSWWLRWQLRGLGVLDDAALAGHGLDDRAAGDVRDRLLAMVADARQALDGAPPPDRADAGTVVDAIPALVTGLDLAAARLVVASLDVDTAAVHEELRRA